MSFQATTAALAIKGISPHEKLLLLAIANYADADGTCWPSQLTLALDTCLTDRTVRTLMHSLQSQGLISRQRRTGPDGYRVSDRISLHILPEMSSGKSETVIRPQEPTGNSAPAYRKKRVNLTGKNVQTLPETVSGEPINRTVIEGSGANAPSQRARATRLSEGWTPSEIELAMAEKEGLSSDEIERTAVEFRNFWLSKAGKDAAKLSWPRTWQNWVIRVADRKREGIARRSARPAYAATGRREPVSFVDILLRDRGDEDYGEPIPG